MFYEFFVELKINQKDEIIKELKNIDLNACMERVKDMKWSI